ncbi:MAG: chemotaxis protein CheD [Gemmatimonadales bacterium]
MKERVVKVADWAVEKGEAVIATYGLGSCVACVLHDPVAGVGGLAHVLLPSPTLARDRSNPAKFPETAVPLLVEEMVKLGAAPERLRARLVGGASMFARVGSAGIALMGDRNVAATREALKAARIPIVGEDTGLDYGRSVILHLPDGNLDIRSVLHGSREL